MKRTFAPTLSRYAINALLVLFMLKRLWEFAKNVIAIISL